MPDPSPRPLPCITLERGVVIIKVRVAPGSSAECLRGLYGEALKVAVRAPPERGRANTAILDLLARELGLRRAQLTLLSGSTSKDKRVRVEGVELAVLQERLRGIL